MKKFFIGIMITLSLVLGAGTLSTPAYASSPSVDAACNGVSGNVGGRCGTGGVSLNKIFRGVLNVISIIAGVVAVVMVVISGLKYIMSSGEAQAVTSAKHTLIYAIVGLVIVAMAQVIVRFVLVKI